MGQANDNGWDFVIEGKTYEYTEDSLLSKTFSPLLAFVTIIEDKSTDSEYKFSVIIEKSNITPVNIEFEITSKKDINNAYGRQQLFENEIYAPQSYKWFRN